MLYHVANIGDARSLAIHPASTTHSHVPEEQVQTGVTPGYVRLAIGIEHIDDILADLEQALKQQLVACILVTPSGGGYEVSSLAGGYPEITPDITQLLCPAHGLMGPDRLVS